MKRTFLLVALGFVVLFFALAGWAVDGIRWTVSPLRTA
jgi:hypothetical protein